MNRGTVIKTEYKIMAVSIAFGLFFWVVDAVLDYFFFDAGRLLGLLVTDVPAHEVYMRLVVLACFLVFGVLMSGVVAKRKRAESQRDAAYEGLRGSEARYRSLVEEAIVGIIVTREGKIVFCNKQESKLFGYENPADLCGRSITRFLHEDDLPELLELGAQIRSGRAMTLPITFRGVRRDGREIVIEAFGIPFPLESEDDVLSFHIDVTERVRAESQGDATLEALRERTHDLDERVKELNCLYGISHLVEQPGITLEDIMQGTVDLMPPAWQYPEIACVRIVLDAQEFSTGGCGETIWRQASDIVVGGERVGAVEVGYREARPESDEGPFLKEERDLIDAIAERLGRAIEQVRADDALRESRERFRALAQVSPVGIFRTDAEGHCLYVNERWCEIAGLTPQEARGQGWAQGIHPDDRERVFAEWYKSAQEGSPFAMEYRFRRPDGVTTWVFGQAMAEKGDAGETMGYVGTITDITGRRRSAEALRRHNEELMARNAIATTIGQSLDLDHILNATLDKVLEVTDMDAGGIQLLDEERGVLSLAAHRGVSPGTLQDVQAIKLGETLVGKIAQSGRPIVLDEVSDDPQVDLEVVGREGIHAFVGVPIQAKDKVLGVLSVVSHRPRPPDRRQVELLTAIAHQLGVAVEHVRLTEQASEIEILRELDRLRSELIANVSHELRTPLGLIKIFCSTLLREDVDFDQEVQLEFLRDIEGETNKLEEIVNNLLDLSLIKDGRLRLDKCSTDLGQLARDVITSMELQLGPHRFIHDFPQPLVTSVDLQRIEQVLRNVLNNAVKYSPDGGTIAVRGRGDGQQFLIQVTDQGIGIAAKDLQRIFERFYRVENEVTRAVSGAGLGLSVCRGIVEAHGGRIWVRSAPGAGSTFYFTLPIDSRSGD